MISVTKTDANNYCQILSQLGMEEEGDPVAWVKSTLTIIHERNAKQAVLQSIVQPITSVSDALNFLEEWALAGNQLHGDDIQQFHATAERIAPIALAGMVPDAKAWFTENDKAIATLAYQKLGEELADKLTFERSPEMFPQATYSLCRHAVGSFIVAVLEKYGMSMLSTSPQPQQAVPDGEVRLWDTQWMKIVNHDNSYRNWSKDDAVAHAVKMTEAEIARNVYDGKLPPRTRSAPAYNGKKEES